MFGTRGNLTFYLSISPYASTPFTKLFSLFYSTGLSTDWYTPGTPTPPHPSAANGRNGRLKWPLTLLATGVPPEGYGAISTPEPTPVDTGHIFEDPYQHANLRHPTKKECQGPPPHNSTATPATAPPGIIPWGLPHPQRPGLRDRRPYGQHGLAYLN